MDEVLRSCVLPVHTASTLALFGLIWMVQVVHYPLMRDVGRDSFRAWHEQHLRRTTWVVGPLMTVEAASALVLLYHPPMGSPHWIVGLGIALVLVVWISTAVLQVPMHRRLEFGWDEGAHRRLVTSNWVRTIAWSIRAVLATTMAVRS